MDFFDKLGEKISSGANAVTNSAGKVRDSVKINNEINSNKSEIDRNFRQLGVLVKQKHLDKIDDPEVTQLVQRIDELILANKNLTEQLNQAKGLKKCAYCGAPLPANSAFCAECGKRVEVQPQPTVQPNVQPQTVQSDVQPQSEAVQEAVEEQTEQQTAPKAIFCPSCGERAESGALFCPNCGAKLL
ncbi:MAG: zinc ribbon domain-containing protein [Ruminococcus sp.]|nr:zinc ribbon domain-containing protein [Ruminococcus sp.]